MYLLYIVLAFAVIISSLLILVMLDIRRRGCSKNLSWRKALAYYVIFAIKSYKKRSLISYFDGKMKGFRQSQTDFLLGRIRLCEDSDYGRDHGFHSIRSLEDFCLQHPVIDYSHVEPYVERLGFGQTSALLGSGEKAVLLSLTSGTTGASKRLPVSDTMVAAIGKYIGLGPCQEALERITGGWSLRPVFNLFNCKKSLVSPGGITIAPMSSLSIRGMRLLSDLYTSPLCSLQMDAEPESHYIQLLFALRERDLGLIDAVFVYNFLVAMSRLEKNSDQLVADVREGTLNERLNIPYQMRASLLPSLRRLPERADELQREFSKGFSGIVPRIWPHVRAVKAMWSGSTNEIYYQDILRYVGDSIPIISSFYMASEGPMGGNLSSDPRAIPEYTLVPDSMFFEFLPVVDGHVADLPDVAPTDPLMSHQLEVGEEYELVVTNCSGLYRYRLGDVVRLTGFHHETPRVQFLYRSAQQLNLRGEKVSELTMRTVLKESVAAWPQDVVLKDWTAAGTNFVPLSSTDFRYLLFLELEGPPLTDKQLSIIDSMLCERAVYYGWNRRSGGILPMKVHTLPTGTFLAFRQLRVGSEHTSTSQFKMPRVLKTPEHVQWFLDRSREAVLGQDNEAVGRQVDRAVAGQAGEAVEAVVRQAVLGQDNEAVGRQVDGADVGQAVEAVAGQAGEAVEAVVRQPVVGEAVEAVGEPAEEADVGQAVEAVAGQADEAIEAVVRQAVEAAGRQADEAVEVVIRQAVEGQAVEAAGGDNEAKR